MVDGFTWEPNWREIVLDTPQFEGALEVVGESIVNKLEADAFSNYPNHGMAFSYGSHLITGGGNGPTFVIWPTAPFTDGHDGKTHHRARAEAVAKAAGLRRGKK